MKAQNTFMDESDTAEWLPPYACMLSFPIRVWFSKEVTQKEVLRLGNSTRCRWVLVRKGKVGWIQNLQ